MESVSWETSEGRQKGSAVGQAKESGGGGGGGGGGSFRMPVHYPRYKRADYETMPEWMLDHLLTQYGLPIFGNLKEKRSFAMGAFLWPTNTH